MEGCPSEDYLDLAIVLSGAQGLILFLLGYGANTFKVGRYGKKGGIKRDRSRPRSSSRACRRFCSGTSSWRRRGRGGRRLRRAGSREVALREGDEQL